MKKFKLVLIGAGQLGSRYLQSVERNVKNCDIWVIDPFQTSLDTAKQRLDEVKDVESKNSVTFDISIKNLPNEIDLAIVATTADVRLPVIKQLVGKSLVKKMILEKVLFQSERDLGEASLILKEKKIRTWVNCSRRIFTSYNRIKSIFEGEKIDTFEVVGGEWGLACNAIHFLDVFEWLTKECIISLNTDKLNKELTVSKRRNFYETFGTLIGTTKSGCKIKLSSEEYSKTSHTVIISSAEKKLILDESTGFMAFLEKDGKWKTEVIPFPFLSEYSGKLVKEILDTDNCTLPSYESSAQTHKIFLEALCRHFNIEICPIT